MQRHATRQSPAPTDTLAMMQRLDNLKLSLKLMLAFGIVLVLMVVQGIVAYGGMSSLARDTDLLVNDTMASVATANETRLLLAEYRNNAYRGLIRASDAVKAQARERTQEFDQRIEETFQRYEAALPPGESEERGLYEAATASWAEARQSYSDVNEMIDLDLPEDARARLAGLQRRGGRLALPLLDGDAHQHAGADAPAGIREFGARGGGARGLVHARVDQGDPALERLVAVCVGRRRDHRVGVARERREDVASGEVARNRLDSGEEGREVANLDWLDVLLFIRIHGAHSIR